MGRGWVKKARFATFCCDTHYSLISIEYVRRVTLLYDLGIPNEAERD